MGVLIDGTLDELDRQIRQLRSELSRLEAFRRQFLGPWEDESAAASAGRSHSGAVWPLHAAGEGG